MSVEANFVQWNAIYLAPNAQGNWWFSWIFDSNHWQRMAAAPDNYPASVQILAEWWSKDVNGNLTCHVAFKNNGSTPVSFRPTAIVLPS